MSFQFFYNALDCKTVILVLKNIRSGNRLSSSSCKIVINCFFSLSSALKNIYLLEFHPSLGLASCIPRALEHLLRESRHTCRPTSAIAFTLLERRVLQLALDVWLTPAKPESWYSAQLQKDVGSLKGLGGSLAKRLFPPRCYYLALFLFGSIPLLFGQR